MLKKHIDIYNLKLTLLEEAGIDEWDYYYETIDAYTDMFGEEALYNAKDVLAALEEVGLTQWEGYKPALKHYSSYLVYLNKHRPLQPVLSYNAFVAKHLD